MKILSIERFNIDETHTLSYKDTKQEFMKAAELLLTIRHNLFFTKKIIVIPLDKANVNKLTNMVNFVYFVDELGIQLDDATCEQLTNWCKANIK